MLFLKHTVKYLSVVIAIWILLYVVFSVHYLITNSSSASLVLNSDQRLDKEQPYNDNKGIQLKSMIHLKTAGYMKQSIKALLESSKLRKTYTNKVNSSSIRKTVFKNTPGNGADKDFKNVPSVVKTIRDRMESKNKIIAAVKDARGTMETDNVETRQMEFVKNDKLIHSVLSKHGLKNESSSDKNGRLLLKSKPDPNAYYNYSRTIITPLNHKFLISNENLCKLSSPELVILVPSSPDNSKKRTAIRATYGSMSRDRKSYIYGNNVEFVVRTVFIVGKSSSSDLTASVYEENRKHEDIVMIDYIDNYRDLTKKVLYGFKWVNEFCSNVSYVMKADDDAFINVAVLTKRLKEHHYSKNSTVFGHVYAGYRAVARSGKWAVTYGEFPLESFPDYMSGTSYTMTKNLIPKILYTAQRLPFLPIEDAFITGVIANRIYSSEMVHWKDNSYWNYQISDPCNFIKGHVSMTNMTPQLMYDSWSVLISYGTKSDGTRCPRK